MPENIKIIIGNIFTSNCQTLVNTVNCYGEMGAGIALEFKFRYPEMFEKYVHFCKLKQIQIGKLWIYKAEDKWILNFPTKNHWKYPSKIEYLEKGLQKFTDTYKMQKIESIAFPLLGAQNGGLEPELVLDLMVNYLQKCDISIEIYKYNKNSHDDLIIPFIEYLNNTNIYEIAKTIELKHSLIDMLKEGIQSNKFNSLIQLNQINGIGVVALSKIYNFAMQKFNLNSMLDDAKPNLFA